MDKPAGWTSHDVVARARGILSEKRVGHAGTLDPDATGVLLLGVGSVTRLLRFLSEAGKRYVGEVVLGTSTDTLDAAGRVTATYDMSTVTPAEVQSAVDEHLTGEAGDPDVLEAFSTRRVRLQSAVGRQLHARKTPILEFRPDDVLRSAERIDSILRDLDREQDDRSA